MQLTEELYNQLAAVEAEFEGVTVDEICRRDDSRVNLMGVANRVRPRDLFGRNVLYNQEQPLSADVVELDVIYEDHLMPAPFVKPCEPAPLIDNRSKHRTYKAKPAYIKTMDKIDWCKKPLRRPGWRHWDSVSTAERKRMEWEKKLMMLQSSVQLSEEQMIWQQLRTGMMTYAVMDVDGTTPIEKYELDFKRSPELGAHKFKWDKKAECIAQDLQSVYDIQECEGGAPVTLAVAGHAACAALRWNKDFRDAVKCARESGYQPLMDVDLDFTPRSGRRIGRARFEGMIGNVDLWCNNDYYICPRTGKKEYFLEPNEIIFIGRSNDDFDAGLTRMYGEIMACEVYQPLDHWVDTWKEHNPTKSFASIESSPLPLMWNANSVSRAIINC